MVNWLTLNGMVDFSCKMCGCCCKKGWNIFIDKDIYKKLHDVLDTAIINDKIKIFDVQEKNVGFAKVADEKTNCGFLEENNLCMLHRCFGFEYLPNVCTLFPRRIFITPRGFEMSVAFSCPETMKLLLSKEVIKIITNSESFFSPADSLTLPTITEGIINANDENRWYFRLEEAFINILQDRVLTLEMRMSIIGILIYHFQNYLYDKKRLREYPKLLKNYRNIAKQVRSMEKNIDYQVRVIKNFLDLRTSIYTSDDFRQIVENVNTALGLTKDKPVNDDSLKLYQEKLEEIYNEREAGYIIANYLVYYLFSKPLLIYGLEGGFYVISFIYALTRFLATGVALSEGVAVNQEILLKVIETVDFNIIHAVEFMEHIMFAQGIEKCEREHVSVAKSLALLMANHR